MTSEEFHKQQYLTLRDEIRSSKARVFTILVLATVLVPAVSLASIGLDSTFANAGLPFILLVLMMAFVMEQNSIVRAGKYLKDHVEPSVEGLVTWEKWLESNHRHRDVDRFFFATFLVVFLLFYVIGTGMAIESIASQWPDHWIPAAIAYGVAGVWFLVVWLRHWHACTSTD